MRLVLALSLGLPLCGPARPQDGEPGVERWITRGYGYLLEVEGDDLRTFSHRSTGDLPLETARRRSPAARVFVTEGGDVLEIRERESDGRLVLQWDLTSHPLVLEATETAPRVPDEGVAQDPRFVLEWFCATYREHYAFFDLRGVDWAAATERARAAVDSSTTPGELFDVLSGLIAPLGDGHCHLEGLGRTVSWGRVDPDPPASRRLRRFRSLVDREYLDGEPLRACRGRLVAGVVADGVGYLRLDGMWGGPRRLERGLDRAFARLAGMRGLIVDVRFNGGGTDAYGLRLSARLVTARALAAVKEVRSNPGDPTELARVGELHAERTGRPGFYGPVVLLVSRHTASAAEVFGMSLLGREPGVTVIGERTEGAFSDVHESTLPNGWSCGLSNEVYRAGDGRCFEGLGLPLDIEIPTLRSADLATGSDPALELATRVLQRGR